MAYILEKLPKLIYLTSDNGFGAKSFAEGFEEEDIDNSELKFSYAGKKVLRKLVKVYTVKAKFVLILYVYISVGAVPGW